MKLNLKSLLQTTLMLLLSFQAAPVAQAEDLCQVLIEKGLQLSDSDHEILSRKGYSLIIVDQFRAEHAGSLAIQQISVNRSSEEVQNIIARNYAAVQAGLPPIEARPFTATRTQVIKFWDQTDAFTTHALGYVAQTANSIEDLQTCSTAKFKLEKRALKILNKQLYPYFKSSYEGGLLFINDNNEQGSDRGN